MSDKLNEQSQNESKNTLGSVGNETQNSKNSPLVEREQIGNGPLVVVGNEEQGYVVALGNFKLSKEKPTKTEAYEMLQGNEKWETICNLVTTIMEVAKEHEKKEVDDEKQLEMFKQNVRENYEKKEELGEL